MVADLAVALAAADEDVVFALRSLVGLLPSDCDEGAEDDRGLLRSSLRMASLVEG